MGRLISTISDWRVMLGAVVGLPVAGFTACMMLWGVPAKASTVAAQGEVIAKHGEDISRWKQGFSDQKDQLNRIEDEVHSINEYLRTAPRHR